jgi:hypothetical protein
VYSRSAAALLYPKGQAFVREGQRACRSALRASGSTPSLRCGSLPFPLLQDNWADMQGKDIYVRNYYSTKAFFDKLPGEDGNRENFQSMYRFPAREEAVEMPSHGSLSLPQVVSCKVQVVTHLFAGLQRKVYRMCSTQQPCMSTPRHHRRCTCCRFPERTRSRSCTI